jgi:hypothetical protein
VTTNISARLARIKADIRKLNEIRTQYNWDRQRKRIALNGLNSLEQASLEGVKERLKPALLAGVEHMQEMSAEYEMDLPKPEEIRHRARVIAETERRHGVGFRLDYPREWREDAEAVVAKLEKQEKERE